MVGRVIQSHVMMHSAPPNKDDPLLQGGFLSTPCEGVRPIYPDLVCRGNMSTSPSFLTENDTLPSAQASLRCNNQPIEFI